MRVVGHPQRMPRRPADRRSAKAPRRVPEPGRRIDRDRPAIWIQTLELVHKALNVLGRQARVLNIHDGAQLRVRLEQRDKAPRLSLRRARRFVANRRLRRAVQIVVNAAQHAHATGLRVIVLEVLILLVLAAGGAYETEAHARRSRSLEVHREALRVGHIHAQNAFGRLHPRQVEGHRLGNFAKRALGCRDLARLGTQENDFQPAYAIAQRRLVLFRHPLPVVPPRHLQAHGAGAHTGRQMNRLSTNFAFVREVGIIRHRDLANEYRCSPDR